MDEVALKLPDLLKFKVVSYAVPVRQKDQLVLLPSAIITLDSICRTLTFRNLLFRRPAVSLVAHWRPQCYCPLLYHLTHGYPRPLASKWILNQAVHRLFQALTKPGLEVAYDGPQYSVCAWCYTGSPRRRNHYDTVRFVLADRRPVQLSLH